jgi:ABC-type bacteriocin/lantibiotic exporter with double-glycine peptidase domain
MNVYLLLFSDLIARLGWRFPSLIVLMTLVGLSEGTSVALLLPLLNAVGFAPAGNPGAASTMLTNALASVGATSTLDILLIIILVVTVQTALFVSLSWWTVSLARRYQSQRQTELFRAFTRARWTFVTERKSGELSNVIVSESERLGMAFTFGLSMISTFVVMIIYFGLSLLIAWQVTLSMLAFALLSALAMARLYRKSYATGQSLTPMNAELQTILGEQFSGIKIVKATASEERSAARIEPLLRKIERVNAVSSFLPVMVR